MLWLIIMILVQNVFLALIWSKDDGFNLLLKLWFIASSILIVAWLIDHHSLLRT